MFYEVIYEDGAYSVASYDSDEEALSAIATHHERATKGEPALLNGPPGGPKAVRIKKILVYDKHPDEYNMAQNLSSEVLLKGVQDYAKDHDVVHVPDMVDYLRGLVHPTVDSGPHETNFKMPEVRELEWQS